MLSLNLKPICKLRGIEKPYTLLVKAGISPSTASKLLNSYPTVIRLDHIEIICDKLNCTPNDILSWIPPKDSIIPESHALKKLIPVQSTLNFYEDFKTMPLEQLNEIAKLINQKKTSE